MKGASGREHEVPLDGGWVAHAVRVGDTVRRKPSPRSAYVRDLLGLFEDHGWAGAPRFLGVDDQGRETLEFVDGIVPLSANEAPRSDATLVRLAELIRECHDLTAGTSLAAGGAVVCHNDLSPENTVYRDTRTGLVPVALLHWDIAAAGERIHDVAHVCWQFVGLRPTGPDVDRAGRQVRLIADGYRLDDRARLIDTILWWQDRCWRGIEADAVARRPHAQALRAAGAVEEVHAAFTWTLAQRSPIARYLD